MDERSYLDTDMCYVVYVSHGLHGPISQGMGYHHNPIALVKYGHSAIKVAKDSAREHGVTTIRDPWGNIVTSFRLEGSKVVEVKNQDDQRPSWRQDAHLGGINDA